jgi:predicted N-acetyltransferase YhbS
MFVPVLLLARLAVDKSRQRQGVGEALFAHALAQCEIVGMHAGCRYLIVDAYETAVPWYSKYGFLPIEGSASGSRTKKMFLDLKTVEAARTSKGHD